MKISVLPRFVVLKSKLNNKYLQLVRHQEAEGEPQDHLQFTGEEVASPLAKFEVQLAKSDRKFVHLKCCSNNKYWVVASSSVAAAADTPEEDQSKSSCTLFHPTVADEDDLNSFRLKSVSDGDVLDAFEAIDWCKVSTPDEDPTVRSGLISRNIRNVLFYTFAGVIFDHQEDVLLASAITATNNSNNSVSDTVRLEYTGVTTTTWKNSDSANSGVLTNLSSGTPYVNNGKIEILPAAHIFSYVWGQPRETRVSLALTVGVNVEPRSRVRINIIGAGSPCEVPFSYTQWDVGVTGPFNYDDGACTSRSDEYGIRVEHTVEYL